MSLSVSQDIQRNLRQNFFNLIYFQTNRFFCQFISNQDFMVDQIKIQKKVFLSRSLLLNEESN